MKLSKTRQALVEEFEKKLPQLIYDAVWEASDGGYAVNKHHLVEENNSYLEIEKHLTQALNDYTESIVGMVEGMEPKCPITSSEKWAYDQALNDIKEALTNDTK